MKENDEDTLQNEEEIQDDLDIEVDAQELEDLNKELNDYKEQVIRTRAEMENQRKRLEREMDNASKYAIQKFVSGS